MITLLLLVIIVLQLCYISTFKTGVSKFGKSESKINGFSDKKDNYTLPVVRQNLVTSYEAKYIIDKASESFKDSEIIAGYDTSIRKSQTTWIYRCDPVVGPIIKRLCEQNGVPLENAEPLQVVKYKPGGFYNDHHDACCEDDSKCKEFIKDGGQRVLTILIYLNDSFEGGATKFTELDTEIKAPIYGGIIFHPLAEGTNQCHPLGLHRGMPITSGTKYVCNLWIREGEYPNANKKC